MRSAVVAVCLITMAACGGSSGTTETTTAPAELAPAGHSAAAVESIQRCVDKLGPALGPAVEIDSQNGHTDTLNDAIATCEEAETELASNDPLSVSLHDLIRYMSLTAASVMVGGFMGGEQASLQSECDKFRHLAADAIEDISLD